MEDWLRRVSAGILKTGFWLFKTTSVEIIWTLVRLQPQQLQTHCSRLVTANVASGC